MASAVATKTKCKYWDKCFRNSETHKKQFLHPGDVGEEKTKGGESPKKAEPKAASPEKKGAAPMAAETTPRKLVKMGGATKVKVESDEEDMDTTPAKEARAKKRKTHEMSQSDGEEEQAEEVAASPTKKLKTEPSPAKVKEESKDDKTIKKVRLRCKYWDKCYQTSHDHKKQFIHPGDYDAPDDEDLKKRQTRGKTKTPLNTMDDGEMVQVDEYKIEKKGDTYTCTCPGWKSQKADPEARTCPHLKEYLGEEFEAQRTDVKPKKKAYIPQHINVSVLLAQKYDESAVNPVGWWMSEKLDGVRAFWNGRCFYSRLGNAFIAPEWFTKDLPRDMHMDGELFGGRGKFQSTVSIVKTPEDDRWKSIKYHVFDCPNLEKESFEKRYEALQEHFDKTNPKYAILCEQTKCTGKKHIEEDLKKVLEAGGEGLMLREPKSKYERRRSPTLLKIKKFYDAEAVVIGHEKGKGRNQFVCGALRCRMECGKEFSVGSGLSDKDRKNPPKIGSIITYKFQEYTNSGSPRFPSYIGIRIDADGPKDADVPKKKTDD